MPRPAAKKLDPKILWVITDDNQPISPTFYHTDLARAALRELSKEREGQELNQQQAEVSDAGFEDAINVLSRENRWLNLAQRDRKSFSVLCEGWLTGPKANVSEQSQGVQQ